MGSQEFRSPDSKSLEEEKMIVLSIDPGLNEGGWAKFQDGKLIDFGQFKTEGRDDGEKCDWLASFFFGSGGPLWPVRPEESLIVLLEAPGKYLRNRNQESLMKLSRALSAIRSGILLGWIVHSIVEIPASWKGPKPKEQIVEEVNMLTGLNLSKREHHVAHAIKMAMRWLQDQKLKRRISISARSAESPAHPEDG